MTASCINYFRCLYSYRSFIFHLPKTFGNFHGKVHGVKSVFHLTQVPFVYALVTKDGGKDIAVNSQKLVTRKWNMLFIGKSPTGKQDYLLKIPLLPGNFSVECLENVCAINIPSGISW